MDRPRFERLLTDPISRRRLLGAGLPLTSIAISLPGRPTFAAGPARTNRVGQPRFATSPFTLGVASGDPLPDGVVLWTRLAPDPLNGGGMGAELVEVRWEVAQDDRFRNVILAGTEIASPELAHSVHADVSGLEPGRDYVYRFEAGGVVSPVGRTRTTPAEQGPVDRLRFATVSCAHYEHGYFGAYRHLAGEEIDLVVCLGDYIYEYGTANDYAAGAAPVRQFATAETISLADYRNRYALYRSDPDLQAAHLAAPWVVTWDDHEVDNDYAGEHSADGERVDAFLARRAAAYQAYYEHMPLRPESMPVGPDARLYRRLRFGDLAEINLLDTRQYRSDQACGGGIAAPCDEVHDPARTLLGSEQESWLFDGLAGSGARWNAIAQQVMMARLDGDPSPETQLFSTDQWDGYPVARQRLLDHLHGAGVSNPVVLTGDVHSAWVADLKLDSDDETAPAVATELVTTSITSLNPLGGRLAFLLPSNPHFAYIDTRHGYTRHELTEERWQADFRAVASVETRDEPIETIASFVVESGAPGAVRL
ncbi:MAG: alkaline phosphatase D family protein [Thermomicrobiales bacterium]|nr:alkaline phosphatase D family protein [Thermomicrobiales bacterium]